ncbi:MAG TPA: hypothetical protein VN577_16515 [Terriglobales bacterium]|nr:hypothetical protein [Terriglobales bacterium]
MSLLDRLFPRQRITIEDQLATLAECGIRLSPEFGVDNLLEFFPREKFELSKYAGLVITMGGEWKDGRPLSDNVWHLDTECIESPGDYAFIAKRMKNLAQGELAIENIRDRVDIENGDAWVEFDLNGETIHWGARVDRDWIDPAILSHFCALLEAQGGMRRFTYMDLKGQDCVLGCATEEELRRLRKETGLRFTWLA